MDRKTDGNMEVIWFAILPYIDISFKIKKMSKKGKILLRGTTT